MAKVKYAHIEGLTSVLASWWNVKGVDWELLQQADATTACVTEASETFNKLRKKLIDEYVQRDDSGDQLTRTDAAGNEILDFGANQTTVDAEFAAISALEFDCPVLSAELVKANREALGVTLGVLRMIKPVLSE